MRGVLLSLPHTSCRCASLISHGKQVHSSFLIIMGYILILTCTYTNYTCFLCFE